MSIIILLIIFLKEIQEKKQQLLYGDFDDEISTESLKYMIERLSDQEQALIQQFVGSTSRESVRFYVDPKCDRASLDSQTVVLFAFSPKDGLATGNNIKAGMDTVFCNIQSQNSLRSASRFVKQQTSGRRKDDTAGARRTFKYRQAETAHVAVYSNQFCFESDVRIAQFGPIVDLPKHPFEAIFDRNTGDLIYYKN